MERDFNHDIDSQQHFWNELRELLDAPCESHESIDDTLRSWLSHAIDSKGEHVNSEYDIARCSYTLISSPLFTLHADYVRRQIIFGLLQDDEPDVLHFASSFLLFDGQEHEATYEIMNQEGAFPRLVELISSSKIQQDAGLHRLLMDLMYEMGRIQKVHSDDLILINDEFIIQLFEIIEELSDDVNDPYHYPVIRLLLVLNEQFMVSAHDPDTGGRPAIPLTNKVVKIVSTHGNKYKTFGENIILLLNRESETSLQLLTLKLLYLLFTTQSTQEYFYTNDLRVLVDILIRNLLDLPEEAVALRHTYLRVLYPLLAHTQLRHPPHYKRDEIRKLLSVLMRGQVADDGDEHHRMGYFEEVDDTTKRLVTRCNSVSWLQDEKSELTESPVEEKLMEAFPDHPESKRPPPIPLSRKLKKRNMSKSSDTSTTSTTTVTTASAVPQYLGMHLDDARESSLSVLEVAAQREKPGVITPSRKDQPRPKPQPPKARRSGLGKKMGDDEPHETDEAPSNEAEHSPPASITETPKVHESSVEPSAHHHHGHHHALHHPSSLSHPLKASTKKKPPPTPKARRGRARLATGDGENGGDKSPTDTHSDSNSGPPTIKIIPRPPPVPVPGVEELSSPAREKESVSAALSEVHAQAMDRLATSLEETNLDSEKPPIVAVNGERLVLAPPAAPPPRGVKGPEFEVRMISPIAATGKSPFEGDSDDEDGM